jgi:hypothetical protein
LNSRSRFILLLPRFLHRWIAFQKCLNDILWNFVQWARKIDTVIAYAGSKDDQPNTKPYTRKNQGKGLVPDPQEGKWNCDEQEQTSDKLNPFGSAHRPWLEGDSFRQTVICIAMQGVRVPFGIIRAM